MVKQIHVVKQQSPLLALFQIWVMRLVETSQEPKISVLISTFQWVYNQIHHRYQINASCVVISHQGKKTKGAHLLTCNHTYNHHSNSFSVVLSALCHQSFAFQHLTAQTSVPYLHRIHKRQLVVFDCAWQTTELVFLTLFMKATRQLLSLLKMWAWKHLQYLFNTTPTWSG